MTTAARPTFDPAKGGNALQDKALGKVTQSKSSRDQPANLKLKQRVVGQDTAEELEGRDFEAELEAREKAALESKGPRNSHICNKSIPKAIEFRDDISNSSSTKRRSRIDVESQSDYSEFIAPYASHCPVTDPSRGNRSPKLRDEGEDDDDELDRPAKVVAEGNDSANEDGQDYDDDDDDDDEEDDDEEEDEDPAALLAELEKIKKERALEKEKKEQEQIKKNEKLISSSSSSRGPSSFVLKRPWDDDVPFKHCSRGIGDKKKPEYVNDTLRSDSHKKFMDKYIR